MEHTNAKTKPIVETIATIGKLSNEMSITTTLPLVYNLKELKIPLVL
jgi:hypothetical protein